MLASYDIRVSLKTNLSYALFPFESHVLHITLDNNFVTPAEIIFESSNNDFGISHETETSGWELKNVRVNSGYSFAKLEAHDGENNIYHPRLVFSLYYAHSGMRQAITILLPLILIFFMSMFSLTINPEKAFTSILALSSAAVTALLAYRFVIENLAPKVGYFMLSDYIFFLLLVATCLIFFVNMGLLELRESHKILIITLLHALVVGSFMYMLNF